MTERESWDVSIDTTKAALLRVMEALLLTDSTMTCSMASGGHYHKSKPLGRGISAELRVHIPKGRENTFDNIAAPNSRQAPPRIQLGMPQLKKHEACDETPTIVSRDFPGFEEEVVEAYLSCPKCGIAGQPILIRKPCTEKQLFQVMCEEGWVRYRSAPR